MKYIIFDIDGVLADCSHRLHYLKDKNYEKFYSDEEIMKDKPIHDIMDIFVGLENLNEYNIGSNKTVNILISGRNERCRKATIQWLREKLNIYIDEDQLFLRSANDYRPAHEVKEDLIKKHIGFENILFAFDDDDQVNEMYKKHVVMCYKPNITKE